MEDAEIADSMAVSSASELKRSTERGVNSARELFRDNATVAPDQRANVLDLNRAKASAKARGGAGGKFANKQRSVAKRTGILSLGRGISTSGSQLMRRSAANEAGVQAAQISAQNLVGNAKNQLIGQVVGAGATLGANKAGWFDRNRVDPKTALNMNMSAPTLHGPSQMYS